jgi:DNA polymerase
MSLLWLDFESRSRCDLKAAGVYNYAQDASTSVLCMSWAFDDEPVVTWLPGQPFPARVANHTGQIRAHNAAFERLIFWFVLCPDLGLREPSLEQFYCTAAQARANCAPGSLEDVGRFAGASMKKDHRGAALIRALCIPQADGSFRDDPALMAEMIAYCEQDVRAMRAISKTQRELSDDELHAYHVNERINDRGVRVDVELCRAAVKYAEAELVEIQQIVREVTEGAITSVRSPKMREWVMARVGPEALKLMTVYKDGEKKFSIDKSVRANLLILAEENADEVPPDVAEVVQCADDLWASSVAKFSRAAALADTEDRRVRGAFVFAGGSATGRASAYGLQVHNYPRKCAADPEAVRQAMVRGHEIVPAHGKRVTDVLKGMLRPMMLPAKGKHLVVADWSSIEGRVNPWLSASQHGDAKLDIFRSGLDPYIVNAAATFRTTYEDIDEEYKTTKKSDRRQVGKVQELALGFGGGAGAFASMGKIYGVLLPEPQIKRAIVNWRHTNAWALPWWEALEKAYTRAMRNKGHEFTAGRITYLFDGQHLWYALPSGRVLCYPFARFDDGEISYAKASWKPSADASEWPRARLWRGLACENVTQAAANDILRHSLAQLEREGHDVVLHVHDEIVCETADPGAAQEAMKRIMCTPANWAGGLPLNVEIHTMQRYGKG